MMLTILDPLIEKVKGIGYIEAIYLFGSRARNDNQERSDIDIAIVCPTATEDDWDRILDIVNNIPTLVKIDCVRFDTLSTTNPLQQAIVRDKIILYKKEILKWIQFFKKAFKKLKKH